MSVPTALAANLVPFALSTDGNTYKNVVCKKAWGLTLDAAVTQEDTDCATFSSVAAPRWSINFEIVLNLTPNSDEFSANDVAGFANERTQVYVKLLYSSSYYRQGAGYISNWQESAPQGGVVTCTGTFTGTGVLDLSA